MKNLKNYILLNNYLFLFYLAVTTILLFLMQADIISYGPDAIDTFMTMIFLFVAVVIFLLRKSILKSNPPKIILMNLISIFMVFMLFYYFMEDGFKIK